MKAAYVSQCLLSCAASLLFVCMCVVCIIVALSLAVPYCALSWSACCVFPLGIFDVVVLFVLLLTLEPPRVKFFPWMFFKCTDFQLQHLSLPVIDFCLNCVIYNPLLLKIV